MYIDTLRVEPTNKAGAEPNSFELCPARRRKTKSNHSKIYLKIIQKTIFSDFQKISQRFLARRAIYWSYDALRAEIY